MDDRRLHVGVRVTEHAEASAENSATELDALSPEELEKRLRDCEDWLKQRWGEKRQCLVARSREWRRDRSGETVCPTTRSKTWLSAPWCKRYRADSRDEAAHKILRRRTCTGRSIRELFGVAELAPRYCYQIPAD